MAEIETEPVPTGTPAEASPAERPDRTPASTVFVGFAGGVDPEQARVFAEELATDVLLRDMQVTLALPGAEVARTTISPCMELLTYPLPNADGALSPWAQRAAAQVALLGHAAEQQAAVAALLGSEIAALNPAAVQALAEPILKHSADLAIATYRHAPFDGLLNTAILAPLTRALYGKRIRFPLAPDFAVSPRLGARLSVTAHSRSGIGAPVLWPGTVAAGIDAAVSEVQLGVQLATPTGDFELRDVVTQIVGSAFGEMESHAPLWQRVRCAPSPAPAAVPVSPQTRAAANEIDISPMIQSFLLASRNLQDVWGLVLPPVTLLDLKRITQQPEEKFRLPDELWVRIVYDFALAYRLRTINRTHLLGALTPLYLGWVASFIHETARPDALETETRGERLARAFEEGKPYLVRRWRWPDRFNP
jgi:hypothetical protein